MIKNSINISSDTAFLFSAYYIWNIVEAKQNFATNIFRLMFLTIFFPLSVIAIYIGTDSGMCSNVKIYSRATWGARNPKSVTTMHTPASLFFVHHTEGNFCHDFTSCAAQARGIQNYHMDSRGIEANLLN